MFDNIHDPQNSLWSALMNPLPRKSIFLTKALIILTLLLLLGLASEHGHAQARGGGSLVGEVTRVVDGDDVVILDRTRRQHRIRLAGIDAPELNQPHGAWHPRVR